MRSPFCVLALILPMAVSSLLMPHAEPDLEIKGSRSQEAAIVGSHASVVKPLAHAFKKNSAQRNFIQKAIVNIKSKTRKAVNDDKDELPDFDIITFDDIDTKGGLFPISEAPYHGLNFSNHFVIAAFDESEFPDYTAPLSDPNFALALPTDDSLDNAPSIIAAGAIAAKSEFIIHSIAISAIIPDEFKDKNVFLLTVTAVKGAKVLGSSAVTVQIDPDGVVTLESEGFEPADRVILDVRVQDAKVPFVIDDLVVEWNGEDGFAKKAAARASKTKKPTGIKKLKAGVDTLNFDDIPGAYVGRKVLYPYHGLQFLDFVLIDKNSAADGSLAAPSSSPNSLFAHVDYNNGPSDYSAVPEIFPEDESSLFHIKSVKIAPAYLDVTIFGRSATHEKNRNVKNVKAKAEFGTRFSVSLFGFRKGTLIAIQSKVYELDKDDKKMWEVEFDGGARFDSVRIKVDDADAPGLLAVSYTLDDLVVEWGDAQEEMAESKGRGDL